MPVPRTPPQLFEVRIGCLSSPLAVRNALQALRGALTPIAPLPEELDAIELVLAEVLNNAVEHAYAGREDGAISITARALARGIAFEVLDEGSAMPGGVLPMGLCPERGTTLDDLPEGGFGWFMIRDLTRDLNYRRVGDCNRLTFRMNVGRGLST
jgi:serine/threonine-protein kinase RsbW